MNLLHLTALGLGLMTLPALAASHGKKPAAAHKAVEQKTEVLNPAMPIDSKAAIGVTPEAKAILADCSAMKFETTVEIGSGADARRTHVKLCSRPGETKEQWIASLSEAVAKIEANLELAPTSRDKLVAAINVEIMRLKS